MNELKELETQLRSWAPRRPSTKLERRLFASPEMLPAAAQSSSADTVPSVAFRLGWLAPPAVALALICLMFNQRNGPAFSASADSGSLVAMLWSNQSGASGVSDGSHSGQNSVPVGIFEWTNLGSSTSSIGRFSSARGTNVP